MLSRLAGVYDRWWRRRFGSYRLEDPRPIAQEAPYTFFLPSENELLALAPGDFAKLMFVGEPGGKTFSIERMWVEISEVHDDHLVGRLDNDPSELHQLRCDDMVRFERHHVIAISWQDDREIQPPPSPPRREFWDRCLVDRCVLDEGIAVYYLYREEPDLGRPEDTYPDSGWRIRGDYRGIADEELEEWQQSYVALAAVLNQDDGWVHLVDSPIGSAFIRDEDTKEFVSTEQGRSS